jgi:uncharacterized protein
MKKILLALALSISMLHAMEESERVTEWKDLPHELQAQILSFVPRANTLAEGLKRLKSLAIVSPGFRDIVNNPFVIETFTRSVINQNVRDNKESAIEEFINALKNGDVNLANMFIEAGINVDGNESAIKEFSDEAAWGSNIDIIKSFIEAGIHLNSNEYAVESFITAVKWGDIDTVKPFIDAGIDVNASNKEGWNALQRTALNNHPEIAQILLEAKADVNAQNAHGYAVTWAVLHNHPEMVKLLLESGANAESINEAAIRTYDATDEIKNLLRQHGANI